MDDGELPPRSYCEMMARDGRPNPDAKGVAAIFQKMRAQAKLILYLRDHPWVAWTKEGTTIRIVHDDDWAHYLLLMS